MGARAISVGIGERLLKVSIAVLIIPSLLTAVFIPWWMSFDIAFLFHSSLIIWFVLLGIGLRYKVRYVRWLAIIMPFAFLTTGFVFFKIAAYVEKHEPGIFSGLVESLLAWFFTGYGVLLSPVIILLFLPSVRALFVKPKQQKPASDFFFQPVNASAKDSD